MSTKTTSTLIFCLGALVSPTIVTVAAMLNFSGSLIIRISSFSFGLKAEVSTYPCLALFVQFFQGSDAFFSAGAVSQYFDVVYESHSTGNRARSYTDLRQVIVRENIQYRGDGDRCDLPVIP